MLHLKHQLKLLAEQELTKLNISGSVLSVRFIYHKCCPMLRITFRSEIKPKPILTGFDYIRKDDYDNTVWHLYIQIDTIIQIKSISSL